LQYAPTKMKLHHYPLFLSLAAHLPTCYAKLT
jgi:hypothetical protein